MAADHVRMPGITLAEAQASLTAAQAAHDAIMSGGKMYRRGDRWVECPPIAEVLQSIQFWQGEVQRLSAGFTSRGPRIFGASVG